MSPGSDDGGQVLPFKGKHNEDAEKARQKRALTLRLAGFTYRQIADEIGYSHGYAQTLVADALRLDPEEVETVRDLETARLDRQLAAVWPSVISGDLNAGTLALKISERRSRLLGLDRPREVIVTPAAAEVQALVNEVLRLTNEMPPAVEEAEIIDAEILDETMPTKEKDPLDDDFSWD